MKQSASLVSVRNNNLVCFYFLKFPLESQLPWKQPPPPHPLLFSGSSRRFIDDVYLCHPMNPCCCSAGGSANLVVHLFSKIKVDKRLKNGKTKLLVAHVLYPPIDTAGNIAWL